VTVMEPVVRASPPEDSDAHDRWVWNRRFEVLYHMRLSTLYHQKREHYFARADLLCTLLITISAASAVAALLKQVAVVDLAVSVATAILAVVQLVLNFGARAREHGKLAVDYRRLRAEAERAGLRWTEEQCSDFSARALEIEADEPPPLGALVVYCQNELAVAMKQPDKRFPLRPYERWFMQLWNFDAAAICARRDQAQPAAR